MNLLDAVEALSALAQDTRLAVFRLLVRESGERVAGGAGGEGYSEGLCAGVIAEQLEVPPATLSFHLAKLEHAGLIKAQRKSLNIFYSADHLGIRSTPKVSSCPQNQSGGAEGLWLKLFVL